MSDNKELFEKNSYKIAKSNYGQWEYVFPNGSAQYSDVPLKRILPKKEVELIQLSIDAEFISVLILI